jgi:hypothetical protein
MYKLEEKAGFVADDPTASTCRPRRFFEVAGSLPAVVAPPV